MVPIDGLNSFGVSDTMLTLWPTLCMCISKHSECMKGSPIPSAQLNFVVGCLRFLLSDINAEVDTPGKHSNGTAIITSEPVSQTNTKCTSCKQCKNWFCDCSSCKCSVHPCKCSARCKDGSGGPKHTRGSGVDCCCPACANVDWAACCQSCCLH